VGTAPVTMAGRESLVKITDLTVGSRRFFCRGRSKNRS
jgi:hypothetical protein